MKRFLFAMLALVLAVGCGGADKKNKEAERPDDGLGVDGIYEVGDYYNRDGKEGVVFEVKSGGKHGKIISLDEADKAWCTVEQFDKGSLAGSNDPYDGMVGTQAILEREDCEEYPAVMWCAEKGDGWYLPSKFELEKILSNYKKINETLRRHDAPELEKLYWSSTCRGEEAFILVMLIEEFIHLPKNYTMCVRAVARF